MLFFPGHSAVNPVMSLTLRRISIYFWLATYLVVGLGGRSLQQIAIAWSDRCGSLLSASEYGIHAYFHMHLPDFHIHSHRVRLASRLDDIPACLADGQAADERLSPASKSGDDSSESPQWCPTWRLHAPHACPLLSVLSTLELSASAACAVALHNQAVSAVNPGRLFWLESTRTLCHLPRGPPLPICVS